MKWDLMKCMKLVAILALSVVSIFFVASTETVDAATKSVYFTSEEGSITIDQEKYLKPKYVHEPKQQHISGQIENYQRAEETILTITLPSGEIMENVIRPTREGAFDFITQITSNQSSGEYEIRVIHKEITIGPAIFKIISEPETEELQIQNVPEWVKNNAGWWSEDLIGDNDFVEGLQYLINQDIIRVPPTSQGGTETALNEIPSWVKNNAGWWAQGKIKTSDFLRGIQFLVEQGIIKIT